MTRIMWLLNHTAARKYEVPMLKRIGFNEIFMPKSHPGFRSASIDYSEDQYLTIPADDLAVMNATDWYGEPSAEAWAIANKHFDVLFFILVNATFFPNMARSFTGAAIWRVYGREIEMNYDATLQAFTRGKARDLVGRMGDRFNFGEAYPHLHEIEPEYLQGKAAYLHLGLHSYSVKDTWAGTDKRVLFVCPDIEGSSYYTRVYEDFYRDFGHLPHLIGGSQAIASFRPNVAGYVSDDEYNRMMREMRVMYYHSEEPNHIHYHPFEAVKAGMPLVFRAGGLLDRLGGQTLPGRAKSAAEAKRKVARILAGDQRLIDAIRESQPALLADMRPDVGEPSWRVGMAKVLARLSSARAVSTIVRKRPKVAVILPIYYRGGSFTAAKLVAHALRSGSVQAGVDAEVVLAYPSTSDYSEDDFRDLPPQIQLRQFDWRRISKREAQRAMIFAGHSGWKPRHDEYAVPDDGITQLYDADVWVMISNRIKTPILPIRPNLIVVYDYLQRYFKVWDHTSTLAFLRNDWLANRVLVTTEFTRQDALQFAGLISSQVEKVPILLPSPKPSGSGKRAKKDRPSFLWVTNAGPHKNHGTAVRALQIYYDSLGGTLGCTICGVDSSELLRSELPHLRGLRKPLRQLVSEKRVQIKGELSDANFQKEVETCTFLWHPAKLDNGTFSVVDAAYADVPSLSSDYPAIREMDEALGLGLTFCDPSDAEAMAEALLWMQNNVEEARRRLPAAEMLAQHGPDGVGRAYWDVVATCL